MLNSLINSWINGNTTISVNTINKTVNSWNGRFQKHFGGDMLIEDITVEAAEDFLDELSFGKNAKGIVLSGNSAYGVYSSIRRVLDWHVAAGNIPVNVLRLVDPACIPDGTETANKVKVRLNQEQVKKLLSVMLSLPPEYTNVKNSLFILLALSTKKRTSQLLHLTWDKVAELQLNDAISKLLANYKEAENIYLGKAGISNTANLLFVKNTTSGSNAEVPCRNTFYTWMRSQLLEKHNLPLVSIDSFRDMEPDAYQPLIELNAEDDYPLLGTVTNINYDLHPKMRYNTVQKNKIKADRNARKQRYLIGISNAK